MMSALFPSFLIGGLLLAAGAVVLHLLSRRPPDRRPLPTARFLDEDRRTLLRLRRRPADTPLLLTRVAFALVLGAAFAGLSWTPSRSGTTAFVLVDVAGAALAGPNAMNAAIESALADAATGGHAVELIAYAQTSDGAIVISHEAETLLRSGDGTRAPALTGLRALSQAARAATTLDSAEVYWVLRSDWSQWTTGIGLLRSVFWPGAITLLPLEAGGGPAPSDSDGTTGTARVLVGSDPRVESAGTSLGAALMALGINVVGAGESASRWTFAEDPSPDQLASLLDYARAGGAVVLSGEAPPPADAVARDLPFIVGDGQAATAPDASGTDGLRVLRASGEVIGAPVLRAATRVRPGSHVLTLFEDFSAAAGAKRVGDGCVVYFAASLHAPGVVSTPEYADLVSDLIEGCASDTGADTPLDEGATAALARVDLPSRVALADVDEVRRASIGRAVLTGTPLTPILLLVAISLIGLESWLTHRGRE